MTPQRLEQLTSGQMTEIHGLVRTATRHDGVAPLSEAVLLAVRDDQPPGPGSVSATHPAHFLTYAGTRLAAYAWLDAVLTGQAATAELVVDPAYRRQGLGMALVRALEGDLATTPTPTLNLQVWSHGNLDGARALALRGGYAAGRELWQMHRSLRPGSPPPPAVDLPQGFRTRHFLVGQDEDAWLQVNAGAFVDHPEQGRMTLSDLQRRMAEPWFDARGFILVEDVSGASPVLAASHWTKIVQTDGSPVSPTEGEVYVVGVNPAYQGRGLGRAVTILGLEHLSAMGATEAMLYVDADNEAAVATYRRLDFARTAVDIMYSRTVHPAV